MQDVRSRRSASRFPGCLIVAMLAVVGVPPVSAQEQAPESTLERIRQTGAIRLGYGSAAPFSFREEDGTVAGYSIDLCKAVSEDIRRSLGLAALDIIYVERTPSNRVQLLNEGKIDIECNASTNTEERRKAARFTTPHFIVETRYVSLAKNGLRKLDDLKGKSVSVVRGTVNVAQILQTSRERQLNLASVQVESVQAAFDLVTEGRVSAFAMDDILLKTAIAASGQPESYALSTETLSEPQPLGFMTRLNDKAFADAVDASLRDIYRRPEMEEIYKRWFMQPIRHGRFSLDMPMSKALKTAIGIAP